MKKYLHNFIVFMFLLVVVSQTTNAQPMSFQFSVGLSTPNNELNNVYNSNSINLNGKFGDVIRQATKLGYFIGANVNLPLSNSFIFNSGIGLHRFPQTELKIIFPTQPPDSIVLKTVQNIIPISVGINWYIFKSFISPYISGNLAYNYIVNSIDIIKMETEFPISTSKEYTRIGAGFGLGVDFNMEIITLSLEARYNYSNLIGRTSNEGNKNYLDLGISIIFGGR